MLTGHKLSWLTLVLILCLYLLFPCGLSTTDGWSNAASVKYGDEIFRPHHLLYNALGLLFSWLPSKAGFEIISCMKVMNAIFAFMTLIVIQQILYSYKLSEKSVVIISCLAGLSFSVLRYATENETYMVPLFFALLASFSYLKFITTGSNRYVFYTGLWATIAVLFHQIYIFWWLGLFTGLLFEKEKKPALLYIIISLIAPLTYLFVIFIPERGSGWNDICTFILGDFSGNARLELTWTGILLSVVNLVRSFVQVHGYIFNMLRGNMFTLIPGIVSLYFVVIAFLKLPGRGKTVISQRFSTVHILIVILQFLFTMVSAGNAEFMVMLPVLVFILIPFFAINYETFLVRIFVALAVWNTSYGLVPLHFKSRAQEQFLCDVALSGQKSLIVASDDQLIKSMIYYQTGITNIKSILKAPALFKIKGNDPGILEESIDSALNNDSYIYTDCLDEETISRSSILGGSENKDFFLRYETTLIKSWVMITGTESIYKVVRKL